MKIKIGENAGFCFGVKNAVELAFKTAKEKNNIYTFGKLIHNEIVTASLSECGVKSEDNPQNIPDDSAVIIRSHGASKKVFDILKQKNIQIIDATCPYVKKIHTRVSEYYQKGYQIVILGERNHPEVIGINGWCEDSAVIIGSESDCNELKLSKNTCVVSQTTFSVDKYNTIKKIITKLASKTLEIFDTICYTTNKRQTEAKNISKECDVMLVLGSENSSNTTKLLAICKENCKESYLIQSVLDYKKNKINIKPNCTVGIVAGASTPPELIMEVKVLMSSQENVSMSEFESAIEGLGKNLREGAIVTGTVIEATKHGIKLNIGQKKDGFIDAEDVEVDGNYNPSNYTAGTNVEAKIIKINCQDTGCIILSKKKLDQIREGNKQVETIRNGEVFELKIEREVKSGIVGSMGTYGVFIPASQIREAFVKDLKSYVGKTLRLTALEINDDTQRIVASARKLVEEERKERESVFWSHVKQDVIVSGKVKRITNFGAFVSVDGFDCLAHIVDLSWDRIKTVDEVLTVGETYDFLVTKVDKEANRVSLSYKLLQPHPFEACLKEHPIGSVTKGKVVSIMPFGAFVELQKGIEGLVHVSEAAHTFIKDIKEVVKVGDEVDVKVLNADPSTKRITLSIKATLPEPEKTAEEVENDADAKPRKSSAKKATTSKEEKGWSDEDTANNPFAELLQGVEVDAKK